VNVVMAMKEKGLIQLATLAAETPETSDTTKN